MKNILKRNNDKDNRNTDFLGNHYDDSCLACQIVKGSYLPPYGVIEETPYFLVHQDPFVAIPGLLVIVVKRHVYSFSELEQNEAQEIGSLIHKYQDKIKSITDVNEFTVIQEDYSRDGHFHIWIFPWFQGIKKRYKKELCEIREIMQYYRNSLEFINEVEYTVNHLKQINGKKKNLESKDYSNQDLRDKDFSNMNLSNADFSNSILKRCSFDNSNLSFAHFRNADLYRATFRNTILYSADFSASDLTRADFRLSKLYGAKLFNVDVTRTLFDESIDNEHINYDRASDIYNTIKQAFKQHGQIDRAAHYYYKQRVAQRKIHGFGIRRMFEYVFLDLLIGYGEKPTRCIYISLFIILAFGLLYFIPICPCLFKFTSLAKCITTSFEVFFGATKQLPTSLLYKSISILEKIVGQLLIGISLIGFSRKIVRD